MRNSKFTALVAMALGILLITAVTAMAAVEKTPKPLTRASDLRGQIITDAGDVLWTKQGSRADTTWITVHDDNRCDATGVVSDGGQGVRAPGYATWCWEQGMITPGIYDSCSSTVIYAAGRPGCFTHFDVYTLLENQWHMDTWMAYEDLVPEDSTPWCGEFGDTLIWKNEYGYGPTYNYGIILDLGSSGGPNAFNAADGFTVGGVHMYDVEINYDYCYLEYSVEGAVDTAIWGELARYNGTCNVDGNCTGTGNADYGCAQYESFDVVGPGVDNSTKSLFIRWRFASDSAWDDEDASGGVQTDGAWRIDHIYVKGNAAGSYYPFGDPTRTDVEDFEAGMPTEWSTPSLPQAQLGGFWSGGVWVNGTPKVVDWWHLEDDPDYANYGLTCTYSNNWMWVSDDEANAQNVEDAYHYRLVSPVFECGINNPYFDPDGGGPGTDNRWSGVSVETDEYLCIKDIVGDVTDTQCRVYDSAIQRWSQWNGDNYVIVGGCQFWNVDQREVWSQFLTSSTDSIQFSWEFLDRCDYNSAGELPCMGQHRKATYIVDNISVALFEAFGTQWAQGASERFADTFARDTEMHSLFKENWELYPTDIWEQEDSLTVQVRDPDGILGGGPPLNSTVEMHWRISTDCGSSWDIETGRPFGATGFPAATWNSKVMNFSVPDDDEATGTPAEFNGVYSTIITIADNSGYVGSDWPEGTVIEYYYTAIDLNSERDTVPNRNAVLRNSLELVNTTAGMEYDRRRPWPFHVKVLPCPTSKDPLPEGQNHSVLVVDAYGRNSYDIEGDPAFDNTALTAFTPVYMFYQESLDRLGIQYDFYREGYGVSRGGATPVYSQPFDHDGYGGVLNHNGPVARRYNTVVYFFGEFNSLTVVDSTQLEIRDYIDQNGTAFEDSANLWVIGDDLCEDEGVTDPTWTDANSNQTTNGAYFWTNLCGLTAVSGGCLNDQGKGGAGEAYKYYLVGQLNTVLEGITKAAGYWDCPTREHPDDGATLDDATAIFKYHDDLAAGKFATSLKRHPSGSKVVLGFVGLELISSAQERDCITQAILGAGNANMSGFNVGIPNPRANCNIDVSVPGDVPSADRMVLHQNRPNPFNPTTAIKFSIPTRTQATLRIYDIAGREVRTLVDGILDAGAKEVTWFGRDNDGRDVTSGVYFYRLSAGKDEATKKMVLIR